MSPLIIDQKRPRAVKTRQFVITPAKLSDVRRLVDIEFRAFENERVNQILSYRDYKKASHFERSVSSYVASLRGHYGAGKRRRSSTKKLTPSGLATGVSFKKVVDTKTGETVSFAKIEAKIYSPDELRQPADVGHEGEAVMNRDWFALNEQLRRDYVGLTPHIYIGMLATEPRHQYNGAGTMLLEEILAEADDAGVEIYLEATDTAKPLYERHGFTALQELRFDPADYGVKGVGIERQTVMVRGALDTDGVRNEVKPWNVAVAQS